MPELPEVETVARGLQTLVAGRRIVSVSLGKTDFMDNPEAIEKELPGRSILAVERYGKFLLIRLGAAQDVESAETMRGSALLVHLGMTGMLLPQPVAEPAKKHTHVAMLLDDGRELRYVDPRRFGRVAYLAGEILKKELERFGVDPLAVSRDEFTERIQARHARIKALLLDQSVVRGVGNIYADESLWKAKIHPAMLGRKLAKEQLGLLHRALQEILRKAIALGGSSISDFLDADGMPGDYQRHHRVYGKEGQRCARCGTKIRRVVVAGRSSHFCPNCQKAPRGFGMRKKSKTRSAASRKNKNSKKR